MQAHRLLLAAMVLGGCGDDGGTSTDAHMPDGPSGPPTCAANGREATIVAILNGGTTDAIQVWGLDGGQLVDHSVSFPVTDIPGSVAMRSDGLEAVVSYGGFGHQYGVIVVGLERNAPALASIKQTIQIGSDRVPWGLAYADDDHVVLATAAGSTGHNVIALDRGSNGMFTAGMTTPVPNDWPLKLVSRPGHANAVLARADLSSDSATTFYLLGRNAGGAWPPTGTSAMIEGTPLDMVISPDGSSMYSGTGDPADPVTPSNLDGKGLLHITALSDAGFGADATVSLQAPGNFVAVSPDGGYVIVDSPVFELDPATSTPTSHTRRLLTVPITGGTPGTMLAQPTPDPALLLYWLGVVAPGYVVRSRQLWPDQAIDAEQTPVDVLLPDGTGNFMSCSTKFPLGGAQARFAVAPYVFPTGGL